MNHEIDLKKYDIHTDLVLDTIENSSLSIKSDTYNIDDIKVTKVNVDEETSKILNKKKGNYITIEFADVTDTTNREKVTKVFEDELKTIPSLTLATQKMLSKYYKYLFFYSFYTCVLFVLMIQ